MIGRRTSDLPQDRPTLGAGMTTQPALLTPSARREGHKGRARLGILAALFLCAACGYHLVGTGAFLPPNIKTLAVPVFKNLTTRFELDVRLTQGVINEMTSRGQVRIVSDPETADAVLTGEISDFRVNPVAFREGAADTYNIVVVARITLRDRVNQKVIFSAPSFTFTEPYEVPAETDFESVETEAIDKVAEKFARSLILNILEGF